MSDIQKPSNEAPEIDPYDEALKRGIHEKADAKNYIAHVNGRLTLRCGGKKKKDTTKLCRSYAGTGTDHPGYGRCKHCGGLSVGPITAEGKARSAMNSVKHGFYSRVLRGDELATYNELVESKTVTLEHEIYMLKAKILTYIAKWQDVIDEKGEKAARNYTTSGIDQEKTFYTASTADDRILQRGLETLRRLIDSHAKLTNDSSINLLDSINSELKGATQGEVTLAWKARPAQQRKEDKK